MANIFIALENPQSMLGYSKKTQNLPQGMTKPLFSFETKEELTRGEREQKAKRQAKKYEARQAYIKEKGSDPFSIDETRAADREVALDFCKSNLSARIAQAGSLVTLVKTMIWYKEQDGCIFHTIVFLGHGNTDMMAVGSGRVRFEEESRVIFNAAKREITVGNAAVWSMYFEEAAKQGCFTKDTDDRLHILLLGYLTGADEGRNSVINVLATTLSRVLNMKVAAYGPTVSIDSADTKKILDHLAAIKIECAADNNYWEIGKLERGSDEESDPLGLGAKYLRASCAG